ncbi:MAG TPA: hypothetical protein VKG82_10675 [Solirubrobacteraceae bacterium]|nr:hypothetical protein [Solirubrobacteraceae bacterium]
MPVSLFVFIQFEFPWALGPADGRYLLRPGPDAEPERVIVLGTLAAGRAGSAYSAAAGGARGARRGRWAARGARPASPEPAPVSTTRATIIDPVPLAAENQARAWLEGLDREREITRASDVLNRVLHAQRIASADPYLHEVAPTQALVIRAGWGEGEQVADGAWLHARELDAEGGRRRLGVRRRSRRDRAAALRPQERLAALLGGRATMLVCEELVLRARIDLDGGRVAHAAIELERAYAAALPELRAEGRQDLALRVDELEKLRPHVEEQAARALALGEREPGQRPAVEEEALQHALGRLESALRARTATGFNVT